MPFLEQMERFDARSLRMVQRILLATDGTLTDTVEAIFNEPVGLKKLSVASRPTPQPLEPLELASGEAVMERRVLICGETTGRTYVYAESVLALNRLPRNFRTELKSSNEPLGRLWSRHRLETWKELVSVNFSRSSAISSHFHPSDSLDLVSRTYCLYSGGQPAMLITEYFPLLYAEPIS